MAAKSLCPVVSLEKAPANRAAALPPPHVCCNTYEQSSDRRYLNVDEPACPRFTKRFHSTLDYFFRERTTSIGGPHPARPRTGAIYIVKNVIELIRVSTEAQADRYHASIPSQRLMNRRTAQTYGLDIIRTIELVDVSGTAVLRTPEMQELLKLIESPDIHGVVAREFSRVMRPDRFTDYVLVEALQDSKTVLYLPDGPIDWTTNSGRLLGTIRAAIAGLERREMLDRSWATKEERRRAGKHPNSQHILPFGVGYSDARGWFYKPEAKTIKKAFKLFLSTDGNYTGVSTALNMSPVSLRQRLENPIYSGWRVIDRRYDPSPGSLKTTSRGRRAP